MSQEFINELIAKLPAQEGEIRIQIGRETVYRGQLGQEPVVNKLTESKIQLLQAVLSATATTQTGEATKDRKGTINIDLGSDRVFRFAQGKIEANALQEPEQQRDWRDIREIAAMKSMEAEKILQRPGEFEPGQREERAKALYLEAAEEQLKVVRQLEKDLPQAPTAKASRNLGTLYLEAAEEQLKVVRQLEKDLPQAPTAKASRNLGTALVTATALLGRAEKYTEAAQLRGDWIYQKPHLVPEPMLELLKHHDLNHESTNILLFNRLNSIANDSLSMAQSLQEHQEQGAENYIRSAAKDKAASLQYVDPYVYPEIYEYTYLQTAQLFVRAGDRKDYANGLSFAKRYGDVFAVDAEDYQEINQRYNDWGTQLNEAELEEDAWAVQLAQVGVSEVIPEPTVINYSATLDPAEFERQQDLNELLQVLCFDLEQPQYAISALSELDVAKREGDESRMKEAWTELYEVLQDIQQRSPHLLPGSMASLDASELADIVVNSVWIDPPIVDVNQLFESQAINSPAIESEPVAAVTTATEVVEPEIVSPEPTAKESTSLAVATASPVTTWLSRAKEQVQQVKVPAIAIAAWEFHETELKQPARQWLDQQFSKVKESVPALENPTTIKEAVQTKGKELGVTLAQKGVQASREVATQLNNLPATIKEQQIAMSVAKLVDTFGKMEKGSKVYQAEKYTLVKSGKQFAVFDTKGERLFEFDQTQFRTANVSANNLNGLQQSEFMQASKQVKPLIESGLQEDPTQLMNKLGNLAPEGTRQAVLDQGHQQVATVLSKSLVLAQFQQPNQENGTKFEGNNYTVASKDGELSLTAKDGRGQIFTLDEKNGAITSQLTTQDVTQLAQFGQALLKIAETAKAQQQEASKQEPTTKNPASKPTKKKTAEAAR